MGCSAPGKPIGDIRRMLSAHRGFTLIEVAIAMVILGLLIGLGAELLPMLVKQNKLKDDRMLVREARTAIIGYALATGKLPYASSDANGTQTTGRLSGYLPWATLGITGRDPYNTTLFYATDSHLANTTTLTQFKQRLGDLISGTLTPDLFCDGTNIRAAFIVVSAGENLRADAPNDDNNNRIIDINDDSQFASPTSPITSSYDDILEVTGLTYLYGLIP
ncbi:MAG TPA: type II secretion system protein [Deltaproteobacteria bacterium]|nr:type II secretion system protein [Deltaproteobacteria bacterium]